jgi:hypothetical protein
MNIILRKGDVLEACADALIVTFDGLLDMKGNTLAQFEKKWPNEWVDINKQLSHHVALGRASCGKAKPPVPFKHIFSLSILDHGNDAQREDMPGFLMGALQHAFRTGQSMEIQSYASPLLRGGWRINSDKAFKTMVDAVDRFNDYKGSIDVYINDQKEFENLAGYAFSFGITLMEEDENGKSEQT